MNKGTEVCFNALDGINRWASEEKPTEGWLLEDWAEPGGITIHLFPTREEALASIEDSEVRAGLEKDGHFDATPEGSSGKWVFNLFQASEMPENRANIWAPIPAPTPEELLAYRDGLLVDSEREELERRIAAHPDAARALKDLADFPNVEPASGVQAVTGQQVDAAWEDFKGKVS